MGGEGSIRKVEDAFDRHPKLRRPPPRSLNTTNLARLCQAAFVGYVWPPVIFRAARTTGRHADETAPPILLNATPTAGRRSRHEVCAAVGRPPPVDSRLEGSNGTRLGRTGWLRL